ncbi:MAG: ROK family protein, partial [Bacteroidota bacterium]
LDESGGESYCGNTGCVETILSGPALQRYYQSISGVEISLKEIYHRYKEGRSDDFAVKTMHRLTYFFGRGISNLVNIIDPDVIVIGGGVGNIDLLYTDGLAEVRKHVFNPTFDTPIVKPKLGDSAGVFGAAFLVA